MIEGTVVVLEPIARSSLRLIVGGVPGVVEVYSEATAERPAPNRAARPFPRDLQGSSSERLVRVSCRAYGELEIQAFKVAIRT